VYQLQVNIQIDEPGANRQRRRLLSQDLYNSLERARSFDVRFLTESSDDDGRTPKGVVEFIPGMLAVSVGLSTSLARLSRILESWVTRDRYKSVRLENQKTGEALDLKGLSVAEVIQVLERWRAEGENNE
jgi:hypothetical protein